MLASPPVSGPLHRPLRVGVLLDSSVAPRWVHSVLQGITAGSAATIVATIVDGSPAHPQGIMDRVRLLRTAPFRLYETLDRRLFGSHARNDALAMRSLDADLRDVPRVAVVPRRERDGTRFDDRDVEQVGALDLDVLLDLGLGPVTGPMLGAARLGVWSFRLGVDGYGRAGPPQFWEISDRQPVSGTELTMRTSTVAGGQVIERSYGKTDLVSLFRTRNPLYWKTARFVERRLADVERDGRTALIAPPPASGAVGSAAEPRGFPSIARVGVVAATIGASIAAGQLRHRLGNEHWFVAWAPREPGLPGLEHRPSFREIPSPPGRLLADPFLAEHEGRTYLFVESCPHRQKRGVIAVLEHQGDGWSEPTTVLDLGHHLSYPSIFQWAGEWYMTPEQSAARTVELYRARTFPWEWELDTVLLNGVDAVDPTIFERDGRWWLFANIAPFGGSNADELHLFSAESPRGPFAPSPRNPVVSDVRNARPAGRPFEHCSPDAGCAERRARGGRPPPANPESRIPPRRTTRASRSTPGCSTPTRRIAACPGRSCSPSSRRTASCCGSTSPATSIPDDAARLAEQFALDRRTRRSFERGGRRAGAAGPRGVPPRPGRRGARRTTTREAPPGST